MAKKVTTSRRRKQEQEEQIGSIFDALSASAPGNTQLQKAADDDNPQPKGPTTDELLKQIEALKKSQDDLSRANAALMTQAPQATPAAPVEPKFSVENLPDPVTHPKEFAEENARRINKYNQDMQAFEAAKNRASTANGNPDELWEDFAIAYPELAAEQDQIAFITSQVVKKAKTRNIDINRYMFVNREKFFKDVADEHAKVFGKTADDNDDGDELETNERPAPRARKVRTDDENTGRTEGIFGGEDQGGNRAMHQPKKGDMVKDLQDMQRKMGYF